MSREPLFEFHDAAQSYNGAPVLEVPRLAVNEGELFGLLGPTGAGKSTLLRLLSGLESPAAGEIRFGGRRLPPDGYPLDVQRRITMVYQRPLLLRGTVRKNVEYGLRIRRQPKRAERVEAVLAQLGLAELASQSAHTLSAGQAQLVALARALVIETDVLLLDEPTANLDPGHVALVEGVIQEARRSRGTTVVWATHDLFQARRTAERIGFLLSGRLIETAPTETFFEQPADPRSADFVQGKMVY